VKSRRRGPQYGKWVTLRSTNVNYVADVTGRSKEELKQLLRNAKDKGVYELQIPLTTRIVTREER
jgi:hypothetical protein